MCSGLKAEPHAGGQRGLKKTANQGNAAATKIVRSSPI
jgi:hypothetical protein